jgi:outer membrane protein assembly factor BamE (lipoprotein component of BamABCDE complex)
MILRTINLLLKKRTFNQFLLLMILFLSACSHIKTIPSQHLKQGSCYQENKVPYSNTKPPTPLHEIQLDSSLTLLFTPTSLNIANGLGILELLTEYVHHQARFQKNPTTESRLKSLELFQKIDYQINLSSLEISAVASELDCEEERISQLADYMEEKEGEVEKRLTVAAIVVGASGAILAGVQTTDNGDKIIGVTGGVAEATLGTFILLNKKNIDFIHPRNALGEIWNGKIKSDIFPPSVWYYLCYFDPGHPDDKSIRDLILQRWLGFEQIENAKEKKREQLIALYFGEGGRYTTEQLYNRASMYDQLESYIKLMKQELTILSIELNKLRMQ